MIGFLLRHKFIISEFMFNTKETKLDDFIFTVRFQFIDVLGTRLF